MAVVLVYMARSSEQLAWAQRWLGTGLSICLCWSVLVRWGPSRLVGEPVALWVCDRAEQALVGLSDSGLRVARVPVAFPRRLAACGDGSVWVLSGRDPGPRAATALVRVTAEGDRGPEFPMDGVRDLVGTLGGGAVVLLSGDERFELEFLQPDGRRLTLGSCSRDTQLCSDSSYRCWILAEGTLRRWELGWSAPRVVAELPQLGEVQAFAWEGDSGWVLAQSEAGPMELWHLALEGSAARISQLPEVQRSSQLSPSGSKAVWLVSEAGTAQRFGMDGSRLASGEFPMLGVEAVLPGPRDGVLALCGGALMQLNAEGVPRPGQGGFRYAVDLASVGPR